MLKVSRFDFEEMGEHTGGKQGSAVNCMTCAGGGLSQSSECTEP